MTHDSSPPVIDGFDGVRDLVRRRAPGLAGSVVLRGASASTGGGATAESVTVSASGGRLIVEADSPSAAAVGVASALERLFDADLSWDGPAVLGAASPWPDLAPIRMETSLRHRYHLNPVTFGYSTATWGWERWERHLDWMSWHGINLPLCLVGHETVLVRALTELGMDERSAAAYVGGPMHLPWMVMGVLHDVGTALSPAILAERAALGRRIVARQRELGMTVVLPGFAGHLPAELIGDSGRSIEWQGWHTSMADPSDPIFARAAAVIHRHQRELFGTDHHYAADPFIESVPPDADPASLADHARAVYEAMAAVDDQATWVLQGWPFHYQKQFWTAERVQALLSVVPSDRLLVLDLWAEFAPMWPSTDALYGRQWLWCLCHNFGGRFALFGDLDSLHTDLAAVRDAAAAGSRGRLAGFGLTMEAIDNNAVVYELATRAVWSPMPELDTWLSSFAGRRYGSSSPVAVEAWSELAATLYGPGRTRSTPSPLVARPWTAGLPFAAQRTAGEALPTADGPPSANVDAENDHQMWAGLPRVTASVRRLIGLCDGHGGSDALHRDVAELTLHVAAQAARIPIRAIAVASQRQDAAAVRSAAAHLESIMIGLDRLAGTRPESMVGRWVADARRWAGDDQQSARALERDARSLISVWGGQHNGLHDYSARHWSGSLRDLHLLRWLAWAEWLADAAESGTTPDVTVVREQVIAIEEEWRDSTDPYPTEPTGNTCEVAAHLLDLMEPLLSAPAAPAD